MKMFLKLRKILSNILLIIGLISNEALINNHIKALEINNFNKQMLKNTNILSNNLLNFISPTPVKLNHKNEYKAIPCGTPFGIKMTIDGVMVVGALDVKSENYISNPATEGGLKIGDVITHIDDKKIENNEQFADIIEQSNGKKLNVIYKRDGNVYETSIKPIKSVEENIYKIGIWIRDSVAGIGTLTFYDENTQGFAGLGHGICDIDTGKILPISFGEALEISINGITQSTKGIAGELKGYFVNNAPIGSLTSNTDTGLYGTLNNKPINCSPMEIASKSEVKTGSAKILTTISNNTPKYYDINIDNINFDEGNPTKNILITIKDGELLKKTGGIVQGMSGSPIIQDGRIIGAITHVLVNNPEKGYAIFAETMYNSLMNGIKK